MFIIYCYGAYFHIKNNLSGDMWYEEVGVQNVQTSLPRSGSFEFELNTKTHAKCINSIGFL